MLDLTKAVLLDISTVIFYFSISKSKISMRIIILMSIIVLGLSALAAFILPSFIPEPYKTIALIWIYSIVFGLCYKERIMITLAYTAMSYMLSVLLFQIAVLPASFIAYLFTTNDALNIFAMGLIIIFSISLVLPTAWLIYRKVRRPQISKHIIVMGLGFIITAVIFYSVARDEGISTKSMIMLALGFVFFSFASVLSLRWVTKTQEQEHELKLLREWQHRDSGRLPAMEKALIKIISAGDIEAAQQMLEELNIANAELSEERVKDMQLEKELPSTGMMLLDAVLEHMLEIATEKGIAFHFAATGELKGIKKQVNQTQLTRLFSDLIKNAIIAVEHGDGEYKEIRVYFRKTKDGYALSVQDRGIPFDMKVLSNLGQKEMTTYAEKGGSGLGYKTIFETIRSCEASLIITEHNASSKIVEVNFNNKNELIYRSYRAAELREACARTKNHAIIEGEEHMPPSIITQMKG